MIRHIIIAAWRNMAANRLISAIAILGLAVGIAAAMMMVLVVQNQMGFDSDLLHHEQTYMAISPPDPRAPPVLGWQQRSDYRLAAFLKRAEPAVENAARITLPYADETERMQHGAVTGWEAVYWADPDIFDLLPLPVLQGDLKTALRRPDGLVIPRATARKYFGRDNVVGQTMLLNGHPMMVRAVIADRPANGTTLTSGIFASGRAAFSRLPSGDMAQNAVPASVEIDAFTYIRLRPHADLAGIERRAAAHFLPEAINSPFPLLKLVPVVQVNMFESLNPGIGLRLAAASLAGFFVLLVAAINFVNLMVARSARRQREVGVRKALGADRPALILQFLGEAVLVALLASGIAMALGEWLLPPMNAFLGTGAGIGHTGASRILLLLLGCSLLLGLVAGAWPAFLLSSFRPVTVLRGRAETGSKQGARDLLVGLQFAVLVVLAISAWVIWQQRQFALHDASRADTDKMLLLRLSGADAPFRPGGSTCVPALLDELRKLRGVAGAACSNRGFLTGISNIVQDKPWIGGQRTIAMSNVEPRLFELYGIKPLAGTLADGPGTIINLATVHMLGFSSPAAAIGHSWIPANPPLSVQRNFGQHGVITAVVPDFAFYSVERRVVPELFGPWFGSPQIVHVRLRGQDIPETLAAIDHLWIQTGMKGPESRVFLNDQLQQQYLEMTRQAGLLAALAGAAILLACMGLIGIAVSTAERRTKEIGVRKAMGADNRHIVALLLWQFAQPVLWANVIAWPVAWWLMRRWLSGFAYHIDLHWWVFAGASLVALTVALLTVAGQAFLTARQKPVLALRTE